MHDESSRTYSAEVLRYLRSATKSRQAKWWKLPGLDALGISIEPLEIEGWTIVTVAKADPAKLLDLIR